MLLVSRAMLQEWKECSRQCSQVFELGFNGCWAPALSLSLWSRFLLPQALHDTAKTSVAQAHHPAFSEDISKQIMSLPFNTPGCCNDDHFREVRASFLPWFRHMIRRIKKVWRIGARGKFLTPFCYLTVMVALVCKKCPKTKLHHWKLVGMVAALVLPDFNAGPKGIERVLTELDIAYCTPTNKHVQTLQGVHVTHTSTTEFKCGQEGAKTLWYCNWLAFSSRIGPTYVSRCFFS